MLYTKDDLRKDIKYSPEDRSKETMSSREYTYKLGVLQFILKMDIPKCDSKDDNTEDIKDDNTEDSKKDNESDVNKDELLLGYTFFLSINKNFNYSWSYLRHKLDSYADFLADAYNFISYVIRDINTLRESLKSYKDLHIEFNELFDVTFIDEEPYVKTEVNWDNLNKINDVKWGYSIIVKKEENILLGYYRKYSDDDLKILIGKIKKILDRQAMDTKLQDA